MARKMSPQANPNTFPPQLGLHSATVSMCIMAEPANTPSEASNRVLETACLATLANRGIKMIVVVEVIMALLGDRCLSNLQHNKLSFPVHR